MEFPSDGQRTRGYLATPTAGQGPGVLVIQEWWGLVDHIKKVCDRFAEAGFSALAPDLYHGKVATEPDEAGKLFMALNIGRAEKDLSGAATFLAQHSATVRLGAVGFCMGGPLALFAGCTNPSIGAVVDFYGIHPNVTPDYAKLRGPVLGLFADKDAFVTTVTVRDIEAAIAKAGKRIMPVFEQYARRALDLAAPADGSDLIDVACGPGTLAIMAALNANRVAAIDFSTEMIERLRAHHAYGVLGNIDARVGDGQALPYAEDEFDAGFSMYGLMFFPDRARGFAELRRVLAPGARAVVSSWVPLDAIKHVIPELPWPQAAPALSDDAAIREEVLAAGLPPSRCTR